MTKTITKRLATAVITMVLLLGVIVGGTYAYFTDSVSIKDNVITAGSISVEADLFEEGATAGTYDSAIDKIELTNFAPGDSETYRLVVTNDGSLNAMYKILFTATNTELADVLNVTYAIDGAATATDLAFTDGLFQTEWAQLDTTATADMLITIELDEQAGNTYQGGTFAFDIDVLATQVNAVVDTVVASTIDVIKGATAGQTVMLANNITSTEALELTEAVNFDLNGKTLTVPSFKLENNDKTTVDIANGTILTDSGDIEVLLPNGTVNLTDVTLGTDGEVILNASTSTINMVGDTKIVNFDQTANVTAKILSDTRVVVETNSNVYLKAETANADVTVERPGREIVELTEDEIAVDGTVGVSNEAELKAALVNGKAIILTANVEVTDLEFFADTTIDLDGHTLTMTAYNPTMINNKLNVAIENGYINCSRLGVNYPEACAVFEVNAYSTFTLNEVTYTTDGTAIRAAGEQATVNVDNSTIIAPVYCITTNAENSHNYGVVINVSNSTFIGADYIEGTDTFADNFLCIPLMINVPGQLNINNVEVTTNHVGVLVRGGTASINELTVNYYDSSLKGVHNGWGSGNNVPSAAISVGNQINNVSYKYPSNVTLGNITVNNCGDEQLNYVVRALYISGMSSTNTANVTLNGNLTVATGNEIIMVGDASLTVAETGNLVIEQGATVPVDKITNNGTIVDGNKVA